MKKKIGIMMTVGAICVLIAFLFTKGAYFKKEQPQIQDDLSGTYSVIVGQSGTVSAISKDSGKKISNSDLEATIFKGEPVRIEVVSSGEKRICLREINSGRFFVLSISSEKINIEEILETKDRGNFIWVGVDDKATYAVNGETWMVEKIEDSKGSLFQIPEKSSNFVLSEGAVFFSSEDKIGKTGLKNGEVSFADTGDKIYSLDVDSGSVCALNCFGKGLSKTLIVKANKDDLFIVDTLPVDGVFSEIKKIGEGRNDEWFVSGKSETLKVNMSSLSHIPVQEKGLSDEKKVFVLRPVSN